MAQRNADMKMEGVIMDLFNQLQVFNVVVQASTVRRENYTRTKRFVDECIDIPPHRRTSREPPRRNDRPHDLDTPTRDGALI